MSGDLGDNPGPVTSQEYFLQQIQQVVDDNYEEYRRWKSGDTYDLMYQVATDVLHVIQGTVPVDNRVCNWNSPGYHLIPRGQPCLVENSLTDGIIALWDEINRPEPYQDS